VARHDSKLVGHVTEVQLHTKETSESRLGIVFDKVITKDGEVPFQSLLLAIRPPSALWSIYPTRLPEKQLRSTANADLPCTARNNNHPPRINSPVDDEMKSRDREMAKNGPTDIDGLSLSSAANGGAQTIISTQRTVKLESGVKIELRVTGQ